MLEIGYKKTAGAYLYDGLHGKAIITPNVVEFKSVQCVPNVQELIKRISKEEYIDLRTGEIMEYNHGDNKANNIQSLKRSFQKARMLINNNFSGGSNELMITLTYSENMTSVERLYIDMDKFYKKIKYNYGKIEYMTAIEPQRRGAWHAHILMRFEEHKSIFIPNKDIASIWKHGYTVTKRLERIDDVGFYYLAYLTDVELTDETKDIKGEIVTKKIDEENGTKTDKKFIKGARLHMYPCNMKVFRHSRGLKQPKKVDITYNELCNMISRKMPDYSTTIVISKKEDNKILNIVKYASFNTKRKRDDNNAKT